MKSSMLSNSLYRRATTECWFTFFLCTTLISSFQFQNVVRHKNVPSIPRTKSQLFSSKKDDNDNVNDRKHNTATDMKRRNLFLFTTTTFSTLLLPNNIVFADDSPLFKKNPLLNPLLEQIRIWEQAEADNIKYGGELERGDAGNKGQVDSYPKLLVPILQISNDINQIDLLIKQQQNSKNENDQTAKYLYYEEVITILNKSIYGKIPFKQIFNAYADNIYYSDPDRANLYLAGGGKFYQFSSFVAVAKYCNEYER